MVWKAVKEKMKIFTTIRRVGGFTITELLLVAVVIALLASAGGGYYFGTYKRMLVEKCAAQMVLTAKYARVVAIEKQTPCRLVVDKTQGRFFLTVKALNPETGEREDMVISNPYTKPMELGDEIKFEEVKIVSTVETGIDLFDEDIVVFRPDGTADMAVVQVGDGKNHYTVYVRPSTGRAKAEFGVAGELTIDIIDLDEEGY